MLRIATKLIPPTGVAIYNNIGATFYQRRQISKGIPQHKKQLQHVDIPDEIEEVTVKCIKRKVRHPRMVDGCPGVTPNCSGVTGCPIPVEAQAAVVQMSYGDQDGCKPQPACKKFELQCPQKRPKRPLVQVCVAKNRSKCKLLALAALFLAALIAGYTYMTMYSREDDDALKKCLAAGKDECECCTDKEAMICCTFVEEPEE